jgi:hypothetical protein
MLAAAREGAAEGEVTNQNVYGAIRTLFEQGVSKKAISRQLGLHVQSVRKWLKRPWAPQKRRRVRHLDRFRVFLRTRAVEVGFNAVVLTRELGEMGYAGSYSAVVKYIAPWRAEHRPQEGPTVRFETGPGEQAQVDWGALRMWVGDTPVRVHLFTMVLGFSRRVFAKAYLNERLDSLLDGHACAFAHFGGRTETILYDNPRTIVTSKDEAVERDVQGPDGLLRGEGAAVPVLPGADEGEDRKRGEVRQAQRPGRKAVLEHRGAQRVPARLVRQRRRRARARNDAREAGGAVRES